MKTLTTICVCISALFLMACGGHTTTQEETAGEQIDSPGNNTQTQPYRCGDWTRDSEFSNLMIGSESIDTANGSNVSSNLMITVSAGAKQALAKRTASGWELLSLPANVYMAQKLCTLPNHVTYLSVMDTNGTPTLLKNQGGVWSTELELKQLTQIMYIWAVNNSVLLTGLTKDGSTVVMSNESGFWHEEALPDQNIPYFLYRFYSVRSDYFTFGFFDFEKGAAQHALLLHRVSGEASWRKVDLPSDTYLIGEMFGYNKDSLFLAGQTDNKSAVLYKASENLTTWETYAADANLFAFTNVWQHGNGTLIAAGQTETQSGPNGSFVQLSGADFYQDSELVQMIDDSAGYPYETWYDASTKNLYLLTSRDLYYRHCP